MHFAFRPHGLVELIHGGVVLVLLAQPILPQLGPLVHFPLLGIQKLHRGLTIVLPRHILSVDLDLNLVVQVISHVLLLSLLLQIFLGLLHLVLFLIVG